LAPAWNGILTHSQSETDLNKILSKLAADGKLFTSFSFYHVQGEKKVMERRYAIQDTKQRPEFQSSVEAMKLVPDRTHKEVTQLLMGRQHSNRWEPL
jgi:hypothetical protein